MIASSHLHALNFPAPMVRVVVARLRRVMSRLHDRGLTEETLPRLRIIGGLVTTLERANLEDSDQVSYVQDERFWYCLAKESIAVRCVNFAVEIKAQIRLGGT